LIFFLSRFESHVIFSKKVALSCSGGTGGTGVNG